MDLYLAPKTPAASGPCAHWATSWLSGGAPRLRRPGAGWGIHGTAAAIEFAVLKLNGARFVVCGPSHCGGIRALYDEPTPVATNLAAWLELGREAALPVQVTPEALRRTEQRSVVLQLERQMGCPMLRERVEAGRLALHGWLCVIEDGEVHVFDVRSGSFVPASAAERSGDGPFDPAPVDDGSDRASSIFNEIDAALAPASRPLVGDQGGAAAGNATSRGRASRFDRTRAAGAASVRHGFRPYTPRRATAGSGAALSR